MDGLTVHQRFYRKHRERLSKSNKEEISRVMSRKIASWRHLGIVLKEGEEWESIWYFVEACQECESCEKPFKNRMDRQLDHDHKTGFIRDVVCKSCNAKRMYQDIYC